MSASHGDRPGGRPAGGSVRRLNRPRDKDALIQQLVEDGPFDEYRDVLVFAAAVGWKDGRRLPLSAKGEPIRWEVATNRRGTEALVNMIAAVESGDPEILRDDRFEDRLAIFEEYANRGLQVLDALLASEPRPVADVILELVQNVSRSSEAQDVLSLADAADELDL